MSRSLRAADAQDSCLTWKDEEKSVAATVVSVRPHLFIALERDRVHAGGARYRCWLLSTRYSRDYRLPFTVACDSGGRGAAVRAGLAVSVQSAAAGGCGCVTRGGGCVVRIED